MTAAPQRRYTLEEYLAIEADTPVKHEYYQGEIFAMAGASRAHNQIVRNVFGELYIQLKGKDCTPFSSETRVKVEATGLYTYPDTAVACKPLHFDAGNSETLLNPRVLIEVVSESTEDHDLGFKSKQYRKLPSAQEMLFFSQREASVEHWTRQAGDQWLIATIVGLDAVVTLSSIQCQLPMRAVYDGVDFAADEA
jgi:Uma2 family endonuclease